MKKSDIDKLDKIWSFGVKEKWDFKCVECGKEKVLNSHHIIKRNKHSLRWNLMNGLCLCTGHHKFSDDAIHEYNIKNPLYWKNKMIELGIDLKYLESKKGQINKNSFETQKEILFNQCKELNLIKTTEKYFKKERI
jgi:hypothetical protein